MKKRIFSVILSISLLIVGLSTPQHADAATQSKSIFTSTTYTHANAFDGYYIANGIDVSKYNVKIDWAKVKAAGVQFAIIRLGYRGWGTGKLCMDDYYETNIKGAIAAGVKVGVYFFTEAINTTEAAEEAKYCLDKIKGYNVELPIVIDYEYPTSATDGSVVGRMYEAKLSKSAATKNCQAFCSTIAAAGYTPMVYASKNDFTELIDGATLGKSYKIWLANYTTKTTYSNTYEFWQYSSKGKVDGISTVVDCNFWYLKDGSIFEGSGSNGNIGSGDNGNGDAGNGSSGDNGSGNGDAGNGSSSDNGNGNGDAGNGSSGDNGSGNGDTGNGSGSNAGNGNAGNGSGDNNGNGSTGNGSSGNNGSGSGNVVEKQKISSASVDAIAVQSYDGTAKKPNPKVTVGGKTLVAGTDYTLSYKNNKNPGIAGVTITGKGNYTGSVTKNFTIKLTVPSGFTSTSGKTSIKLKWTAKKGVGGYQIYRKTAYNGTFTKIKTIQKAGTSTFTNSSLGKDHEYYYRIRAYAKVGSKTYYSAYADLTTTTVSHGMGGVVSKKIVLLKKPSTSGAKLVTVPKDAPIRYLGKTYLKNKKAFSHIQYTSGTKTYNGYVAALSGVKYYSLGVTTANLNIRKTGGATGQLIGVIPTGTAIPLIASKKVSGTLWYKTKYHDGKKILTGWVSSDYVLKQ